MISVLNSRRVSLYMNSATGQELCVSATWKTQTCKHTHTHTDRHDDDGDHDDGSGDHSPLHIFVVASLRSNFLARVSGALVGRRARFCALT